MKNITKFFNDFKQVLNKEQFEETEKILKIYEEYFQYYIDSILIDSSVVAGYLPSLNESFTSLKNISEINRNNLYKDLIKTKNNLKNFISSYFYFLLIVFLLSGTISFVFLLLISQIITKKMKKILFFLESISKGDLTKKIDDPYKDEIGDMISYTNVVRESIDSLIDKIKKINQLTYDIGKELKGKTDDFSSAIHEISEQLNQMNNNTNFLYEQINESNNYIVNIKSLT